MTLHTKCSRGSNNQEIYIETCVEYGDIVDVFSINFPCCALTTSPHLTQEVSCLTREDFLSSSEGFLCYLTREDLTREDLTREAFCLTREDFLPHKRGLGLSLEGATFSFLFLSRTSTPHVGLAHRLTLRTCRNVSSSECVSSH
jgi:hypothetical protein